MAQTVSMQSTSGTAVGRKATIAPICRPIARPFTSQRPRTAAARATEVAFGRKSTVVHAAAATESPSVQKSGQTKVAYQAR